MTALATRTCARCGATADQVQLGRLVSEPASWTYVTVGGLPVCNVTVCPACTRAVRELFATNPDEAERRRDIEREAAFRDGFEAGLAEPRPSLTGWFVQHETRQLLWASTIDLVDEPVTPLTEWLTLQHAKTAPAVRA